MYKNYPWQKKQWEYLLARHRQSNVPHALLFSGQPGLGKLIFAKAFAELLLCKESGADRDFACGQCSACKLVAVNNHPDLILIQPEKEGGIIKVDQVRSLIADLSSTAQQGGYQVVIISPANAMNIASANALLKTLEEPMGKTIMILLSDKPTMLPATIRSRCQLLSFGAPSLEVAEQWLQGVNSTELGVKEARLALNFAAGSPLTALDLLQKQKMQDYEKLRQEIIGIMQGKANALTFATEHSDDDVQLIATIFLNLIMDVIKLRSDSTEGCLANQDKIAELKELSLGKAVSLINLFALCDYLLQLNKMLNNHVNFNKQLLLEALCFKCRDYFK